MVHLLNTIPAELVQNISKNIFYTLLIISDLKGYFKNILLHEVTMPFTAVIVQGVRGMYVIFSYKYKFVVK